MSAGELFIERLIHAVPELKGAYDEHLADNDMLLPHVLMGDVTRFIVAALSDADNHPIVRRVLDYFESELMTGGAESLDLIRSSFVENLLGERIIINKLKPLMGPDLRREIETICET